MKPLTQHAASILLEKKCFFIKWIKKKPQKTIEVKLQKHRSPIEFCVSDGSLYLSGSGKAAGVDMGECHLFPPALDGASVMSDDREMSASDIHPITFNRRFRHTSSDDGQTAEIKVEKIAG